MRLQSVPTCTGQPQKTARDQNCIALALALAISAHRDFLAGSVIVQ